MFCYHNNVKCIGFVIFGNFSSKFNIQHFELLSVFVIICGNPTEFKNSILHLQVGETVVRNKFLFRLVENLYQRAGADFERGQFRVYGDTVDIFLAYADYALRISFWGDEIEKIAAIDPETGKQLEQFQQIDIFPANLFVSSPDNTRQAITQIQDDLVEQVANFKEEGKLEEANRLEERVNYDLEMIRELGYCSGIEHYSRCFDRREPGERPFCLLDYFPDDFLMVIDESHVTLPQVRGMYGGDRSRKINLVDYGFRLQAAIDNRPLKFDEFEGFLSNVIYVSATPADYEMLQSEGVIVEQLIRPTGLLDPIIEVFPSKNQIYHLIENIQERREKDERVLVTTLTKRMAEELQKYLDRLGIPCRYIHSEIDTIERVEILRQLRLGDFDVLIGVNLLREGLDLPEVSLVAILDADKEGFLRNERSLVQTVGRAARNVNGKVLMYADKMTDSMQRTIDETARRRLTQEAYNIAHHQVPTALVKSKDKILESTKVADGDQNTRQVKLLQNEKELQQSIQHDSQFQNPEERAKELKALKKAMESAAKELDFIEAARIREIIKTIEKS